MLCRAFRLVRRMLRSILLPLAFASSVLSAAGSVSMTMGEQKIVDGQIEGGTIKFETVMDFFGQERRMKWEGKLEGDELKLKMVGGPPPGMVPPPPPGGGGPGGPGGPRPGGGGGPFGGGEMVAKRGESASLKARAEANAKRPKPTLPELKPLTPDGLAPTPPMGWNSFNKFGLRINDKLIREVADALVSSGLRDAGYVYLNLDDGWQGKRDGNGVLQPQAGFPDMKALGDYLHAKGLRFGIYSSPGPQTCGGFEGSHGYEEQDARTFAAWGVDLVKYDWCSASRVYAIADQQRVYQKFGEALRATGRPIVLSLCQYGANNVGQWGAAAGGHLWRTTMDIRNNWASVDSIGFAQNDWAKFAGPGGWNDPDMLEVGNGGLNADEERAHFTLWAMLAAPLIAGHDVRATAPDSLAVLINKEVIAIDQDRLGRAASRIAQDGDAEVWVKPLSGGAWAIALFNRGGAPRQMGAARNLVPGAGALAVRDVWAGKDLGEFSQLETTVPAHGVVLLHAKRLSK